VPYHFTDQLDKGKQAESQLDAHFSEWCDIVPATADEQRRGIDRWFTNRITGRIASVEYKTDWRAARSGNAFIETVSVDTSHKAGWVYTCAADWLLYFCPGRNGEQAYWVSLLVLRAALAQWVNQYPARTIPNDGYNTVGVLVPLAEMERIADQVVNIGGGV
jgi:hypothetical protein